MAKTKGILGALALIGLIFGCTQAFAAYTIDGDLSDWGIDLSGDWSQNGTWLPNSGVSFIVEDNRDPQYGVAPMGVHIRGVGHAYTTYKEPKVILKGNGEVIEPYGSPPEEYDIEAMYMDQDANNLYVVIITSLPQDGTGSVEPQDLALNIDQDPNTGEYGYEFGVKLGTETSLQQFGIYNNIHWGVGQLIPANKPTVILSGTKVGDATGAYVDLGKSDNSYPNYVVEMAIPKSTIGNPTKPVSIYDLFTSEYCGNDHIPTASEFPILITGALLLVSPAFAYLLAKKRQKKK
jgi:hypothetical protein